MAKRIATAVIELVYDDAEVKPEEVLALTLITGSRVDLKFVRLVHDYTLEEHAKQAKLRDKENNMRKMFALSGLVSGPVTRVNPYAYHRHRAAARS